MFNHMKSLHYATLRKAQDAAVWLNFKHKQDDDFKSLAVLHGANDDFVLLEEWEAKEMLLSGLFSSDATSFESAICFWNVSE